MDTLALELLLRRKALEEGFSACGIAHAAPAESEMEHFDRWIAEDMHGSMRYMERHHDVRLDPQLLIPDCKSLIVVALNHYPSIRRHPSLPQIAYHAYGRDYHEEVKERLGRLLSSLQSASPEINGRVFCDTAPIFERYWATQAGIGWIGRNHLLQLPRQGSYFSLGILALNIKLPPDTPTTRHACGTCRRCIDACPTGALCESGFLDARRCLAHITFEARDPLPDLFFDTNHNSLYGCMICQEVCPWNRFAKPTTVEAFHPNANLPTLGTATLASLSEEQFRSLFAHTALARGGHARLQRNLAYFLPSRSTKE